MSRRRLLADLGRFSIGAVLLGAAAVSCGGDPDEPGDAATGGGAAPPGRPWARVDLGFVSAYVVARDGEGTVIDTGVAGSEGSIGSVLDDLGLDWSEVGQVILTHKHPDHVGSVDAVLRAADGASLYAGEADIPAISTPRDITPVTDGDRVADLQIVATPGHTPGHVSVLDPEASVLFAGDALNGGAGGVLGPNAQFTEDMDTAWESVAKLAGLRFDTVVFGHGEPVEGDAAAEVAELERG